MHARQFATAKETSETRRGLPGPIWGAERLASYARYRTGWPTEPRCDPTADFGAYDEVSCAAKWADGTRIRD